MTTDAPHEWVPTVVVGGGQAGLAMGRQLQRLGLDHVILEENAEVGASWRKRWDSLKLFTPARYSGLPDLPFPGPGSAYPGKDDVADYLAAYADHFDLPVRTGVTVDRLRPDLGAWLVETDTGTIGADNVVVATGAFHTPRIPDFAGQLDPDIVQLHSRDYRRPSQIRPGDVLVVGVGSSGAEIALELSEHHRVTISGRDPGQEPVVPGTLTARFVTPLIWFAANHVATVHNPLGRRVRDRFLNPPRGIPRGGRSRPKDLAAAGVEWVSRTTGTHEGLPVLEDGRVIDVASVIWCTGFAPDYSWIDGLQLDEFGFPLHDQGVVESRPGLYFLGLQFQSALASPLVGGVGRDAAHLAGNINRRASVRSQPIPAAG